MPSLTEAWLQKLNLSVLATGVNQQLYGNGGLHAVVNTVAKTQHNRHTNVQLCVPLSKKEHHRLSGNKHGVAAFGGNVCLKRGPQSFGFHTAASATFAPLYHGIDHVVIDWPTLTEGEQTVAAWKQQYTRHKAGTAYEPAGIKAVSFQPDTAQPTLVVADWDRAMMHQPFGWNHLVGTIWHLPWQKPQPTL